MHINAAERKRLHQKKYKEIDDLMTSEWDNANRSLQSLYAKMIKAHAAFNLIKITSDHKRSYKLAVDLYRTASRYHAPKYIYEVTEYLSMYHSMFEFNRKKALKYAKASDIALNHYLAELRLSKYRIDFLLNDRSSHSKRKSKALFEQYWREIEPQIEQIKSWQFNRIAYVFGCQYYFKIEDRKNLLRIAEAAIVYLESFSLQSNHTLAIIYKYKLNCLIDDPRQFSDEGFIKEYEGIVRKGTTNWFNLKYEICRLRFNQSRFIESKSILEEVFRNSHFNDMPDSNQSKWKILRAYQNFFQLSHPEIKSPSRYKIGKLLNETDASQLQSNEETCQLHIIKLIFLFYDRKTKAIEQCYFAIDKFMTRIGLRRSDKRTYTFVKMLMAIPENQYHSVAIKRHTDKFYKKLSSLERMDSFQFESIEIIPYEELWELVLSNFKSNR